MIFQNIREKVNQLNLVTLLKIVPVVFTFHELEEWNVLAWHREHQSNIPDVSDIDLRTVFLFLIIAVFLIFYFSLLFRNKKITAYILFPFLGLMFYNGLVHLYWTFYFSDYSPGLIFGFFIGVPLVTYIMFRMIREKLVKRWYALLFSALFAYMFIEVLMLGDQLEPGIVNAMLLGKQLTQWIWL